jgi:hypothetical protein
MRAERRQMPRDYVIDIACRSLVLGGLIESKNQLRHPGQDFREIRDFRTNHDPVSVRRLLETRWLSPFSTAHFPSLRQFL